MAKKIDVNGLDHYHDKVSAMLASEYSSSKTYAVGDYCFHAGTLYECTTAITTAENWTSGHWTAAKLAEDTSALKTALTLSFSGNQWLESSHWVVGLLNDTVGQQATINTAFNNRTACDETFVFDRDITLTLKDGFYAYVVTVNDSNVVLTSTTLISTGAMSKTLSAGTKFRVGVMKYPVETVTDIKPYTQALTLGTEVGDTAKKALASETGLTTKLNFLYSATEVPERYSESFSTSSSPTNVAYLSNRILQQGKRLESVYLKSPSASTTGKIYIIRESDNTVTHSIPIEVSSGWNTIKLGVNIEEDSYIAFYGFSVYFGSSESASYADYSLSTDGLYQVSQENLSVGDVVTISRTATKYFVFTFYWTISDGYINTRLNEKQKSIIVDPNGNGDFTSLCEALIYASTNLENASVYVKRGTYDVISEMTSIYGNSYFDNMTSSANGSIYLQNGIHVYCEPETVMTCYYTGDNTNVLAYFSPLNLHLGETFVENLTIKASRVRYCVHDEQWDSTPPYIHKFKNCSFEIDNSGNLSWDRRQAYGGGLGANGYIEFENCYFKSGVLDGTAFAGYASCSFHNSPSANACSKIVLNNCYFADNSTFVMTYYGTSTLISKAFLSGCSLGHEIQTGPENASATVNNIEIIDCNNIVRS